MTENICLNCMKKYPEHLLHYSPGLALICKSCLEYQSKALQKKPVEDHGDSLSNIIAHTNINIAMEICRKYESEITTIFNKLIGPCYVPGNLSTVIQNNVTLARLFHSLLLTCCITLNTETAETKKLKKVCYVYLYVVY